MKPLTLLTFTFSLALAFLPFAPAAAQEIIRSTPVEDEQIVVPDDPGIENEREDLLRQREEILEEREDLLERRTEELQSTEPVEELQTEDERSVTAPLAEDEDRDAEAERIPDDATLPGRPEEPRERAPRAFPAVEE